MTMPSGKKCILAVDDAAFILSRITDALGKHYDMVTVNSGTRALKYLDKNKPDLILLDIKLPWYNGFYWCSEIRKSSKVPIIFVSSADDDMNIVTAMDMGGDDFIAKPFSLPVLTAKIHAVLRRVNSSPEQINILEHKGVRLNLSDATVVYQEQSAELTRNEFKILWLLMEHAGKMVSRDTIMMQLWESESFIDDNTLTVNVARIRKKLKEIGAPDYIITKKGIGYLV